MREAESTDNFRVLASALGRIVGPVRGEEVGEIGKLGKYCERRRFRPENLSFCLGMVNFEVLCSGSPS